MDSSPKNENTVIVTHASNRKGDRHYNIFTIFSSMHTGEQQVHYSGTDMTKQTYNFKVVLWSMSVKHFLFQVMLYWTWLDLFRLAFFTSTVYWWIYSKVPIFPGWKGSKEKNDNFVPICRGDLVHALAVLAEDSLLLKQNCCRERIMQT